MALHNKERRQFYLCGHLLEKESASALLLPSKNTQKRKGA